ncbi:MAG TPA: serine hydrolase domain-containing protein [Streptosporangiaceae bacterium]|nr:serine hydrolase domain-containing protein [Streptosporangiaceae bacterium]
MSQEPAPEVQGVPVTALNWQDPPANRWAFWHVGDLLPTYRVPRGDGTPRPLPAAAARPDLLSVPVTRMGRTSGPPVTSTVGDVLGDTYTDAYLVLQDGALVTEWYGPLGAPDRPHALMSVSKSVVGCVAAVLIDRGLLDPDAEITSYVPELAGSGYAGALVRHVYDMRSGVRFGEEYANPDSDIRRLDEWVEWQPGRGQEPVEPRGLYRFLATLQAEAPHGERFLYRSAESDVLGWVCERAAGRPMAALISELIWAPMGAEHDALLLHDGLGTAVHDGGLCATARDVARFGQMLLDGGQVPGGFGGVVPPPGGTGGMGPPGRERASSAPDGADGTRRVVPPQWLRRAWAVDADARGVFAASPAEWAFPGGWYRHQFWFRPGDHGDVLLCLGIHGQMLHVSRRTSTVCVKFSTWPDAQNPAYLEDTLRAFDAVGGFLAGRAPAGPGGRRLAGVVSGLSRRGDTVPPRPTVV